MARKTLPNSPLAALGVDHEAGGPADGLGTPFPVRLPRELESRLRRYSAETGRSRSEILEEALQTYLEERTLSER